MQAQIQLEKDEVVIRFPKDLISQEALSNLLAFIEFTATTQKEKLVHTMKSETAPKDLRHLLKKYPLAQRNAAEIDLQINALRDEWQ